MRKRLLDKHCNSKFDRQGLQDPEVRSRISLPCRNVSHGHFLRRLTDIGITCAAPSSLCSLHLLERSSYRYDRWRILRLNAVQRSLNDIVNDKMADQFRLDRNRRNLIQFIDITPPHPSSRPGRFPPLILIMRVIITSNRL